jgi:hypothetical protein
VIGLSILGKRSNGVAVILSKGEAVVLSKGVAIVLSKGVAVVDLALGDG